MERLTSLNMEAPGGFDIPELGIVDGYWHGVNVLGAIAAAFIVPALLILIYIVLTGERK